MDAWLYLSAGGLLLYFGAEWFVGGASSLALSLRIPQVVVGLTVVAYGTSAPELVVGIQAAHGGRGDVALGNVVGSNIANIGLILGVAALVRPARVDGTLQRRELPALLLTATAVPFLLIDGKVSFSEGASLVLIAIAYTWWMVRSARANVAQLARADALVTADAADAAGAPHPRGPAWSAATAVVGLVVLLVGGNLFVDSAVVIARQIGLSDRIVGLSVVAVGTSLPELVTSVIAAVRGHSDIAIGNVVGSNIFNVLLCLGGAAMARPIMSNLSGVAIEVAMMVLMTLLAAAFIRSARTITRSEGATALLAYVVFMAFLLAHP